MALDAATGKELWVHSFGAAGGRGGIGGQRGANYWESQDRKDRRILVTSGGYLHAIDRLKPGIWPHNDVSLDISANSFRFKVGSKKWQAALGGTDSLYFLMAYHYGLLTLSAQAQCHYPGLAILDMPAEFAGELIEDKENFIVQPFIEL